MRNFNGIKWNLCSLPPTKSGLELKVDGTAICACLGSKETGTTILSREYDSPDWETDTGATMCTRAGLDEYFEIAKTIDAFIADQQRERVMITPREMFRMLLDGDEEVTVNSRGRLTYRFNDYLGCFEVEGENPGACRVPSTNAGNKPLELISRKPSATPVAPSPASPCPDSVDPAAPLPVKTKAPEGSKWAYGSNGQVVLRVRESYGDVDVEMPVNTTYRDAYLACAEACGEVFGVQRVHDIWISNVQYDRCHPTDIHAQISDIVPMPGTAKLIVDAK